MSASLPQHTRLAAAPSPGLSCACVSLARLETAVGAPCPAQRCPWSTTTQLSYGLRVSASTSTQIPTTLKSCSIHQNRAPQDILRPSPFLSPGFLKATAHPVWPSRRPSHEDSEPYPAPQNRSVSLLGEQLLPLLPPPPAPPGPPPANHPSSLNQILRPLHLCQLCCGPAGLVSARGRQPALRVHPVLPPRWTPPPGAYCCLLTAGLRPPSPVCCKPSCSHPLWAPLQPGCFFSTQLLTALSPQTPPHPGS